MDHLNLTIAKESRSACAISGKTFRKESVLTGLVSTKPVALSVDSINIDQRVVENASVQDKDNNLTYTIHGNANEKVSFCEQIERSGMSSTIDGTTKKGSGCLLFISH